MFSASKVALQPAASSAPMGWAYSTYAPASLKDAQKIAALKELWVACPVGKGQYMRLAAE